MKAKKIVIRTGAAVLAGTLFVTSTAPVNAAAASQKEEVIYANLDTAGSVKEVYAVNIFEAGDIVDYGNYSSVKMLNTSDAITLDGDTVTFSTTAEKAYYQGNLEDGELPWSISLRYYLDGTECEAKELAGKSGALTICFEVTENEQCAGDFYDNYALQASFTLDTEKCSNIQADDATVANVGSSKQLTYTILPGDGIDTAITADVVDFEMDAVSINGIQLCLNVNVDDEELMDQVNELTTAISSINSGADQVSDGADELESGALELTDGASSLCSGASSLKQGVSDLQSGMSAVGSGLDSLNSQSDALTEGAEEFNQALLTLQAAVDSMAVSDSDLTKLAEASEQMDAAITDLYEGAAALQENLGYAQYKALMAQSGLDIDALAEENAKAVSSLNSQIAALQMQKEAAQSREERASLQEQIAQLQEVVELLAGNNAALSGMESYLDGISEELPALTQGLSELDTQYETFHGSIVQLTSGLGSLVSSFSQLSNAINQLVESYEALETGVDDYTDGVAQIVAGYSQVLDGVSSLAEGSRELLDGSDELYGGTVELYDGVISLCDGTKELGNGTGELEAETSDLDTELEDKIDAILDSIGGSSDAPMSFVSEKNTNVTSVQFVIQTEAVQMEEETSAESGEEHLTFWQKLTALFKR